MARARAEKGGGRGWSDDFHDFPLLDDAYFDDDETFTGTLYGKFGWNQMNSGFKII